MHNMPQQWLSLMHQSHAFYNVKATVPLPLAFLPDDIFLYVPLIKLPDQLGWRKEIGLLKKINCGEKKAFQRKCWRFGEFPVKNCNRSLGQSSLMVHTHRCRDKLLISSNSLGSGLEKCPLAPVHWALCMTMFTLIIALQGSSQTLSSYLECH